VSRQIKEITPISSGYRCWHPRIRQGVRLALGIWMCFAVTGGAAQAGLWDSQKKSVVLDPGHGGADTGMTQPEVAAEKIFTLAFARMMEAGLQEAVRVVLTRTDDYALDLIQRTAVANHEKASLFISIHTRDRPAPENQEIDLFCFDAAFIARSAEGPLPAGPQKATVSLPSWDALQTEHQAESRRFAGSRKEAIEERHGFVVPIHHAPRFVLKGADMPAVLIEIGGFSSLEDAMRSRTSPGVAVLVKTVCDAVIRYLQ